MENRIQRRRHYPASLNTFVSAGSNAASWSITERVATRSGAETNAACDTRIDLAETLARRWAIQILKDVDDKAKLAPLGVYRK